MEVDSGDKTIHHSALIGSTYDTSRHFSIISGGRRRGERCLRGGISCAEVIAIKGIQVAAASAKAQVHQGTTREACQVCEGSAPLAPRRIRREVCVVHGWYDCCEAAP